MPFALTALIVLIPLAEIATFVIVGSEIGALATVALTIAMSVAGAVLMRWQGFGILGRLQRELETGGSPGRELAHGAMVLLAGVLLLIPGFLTGLLGLLLFIPPVRDLAWRFLRSRATVMTDFSFTSYRATRSQDSHIVDLDHDEYSRTTPGKPGGSPWRRPELE
ncbi:MAG: membrane protein FxsA [Rhizobiaceae bacterium]|nr:MAG: membrane protein FxsA [Rhizobiaceae bacterium]CAG1012785.1 hypothetical protein RHIZO_04338 [Rhizobiaceae bacterium]